MAIIEEQEEAQEQQPVRIEKLEPGVYFGLDERVYHADPALGSSDMRALAKDPRAFWWGSKFNPLRDDDDDVDPQKAEARAVGRAMHAAVLEGREALEARFAVRLLSGSTKPGKAEKASIIESGREPIKGQKAWDRILLASTIIRNHPHYGNAFHNTIGTEVSVVWDCKRSGIRKKSRFDAIKPFSLGDLKSITNRDDKLFEDLCKEHIGKYGYYVQTFHYQEGWGHVGALIKAGAVFGAEGKAIDRLAKAAQKSIGTFVFVFVQKKGAPLVWGVKVTPGNSILDNARVAIENAEANWQNYYNQFGLDQPWLDNATLEELAIEEIPAWTFRR